MLASVRTYSKKSAAVAEIFSRILEEQIDNSTASQIKNNPELQRILDKYSPGGDAEFKDKYQDKIGYLKLEKLLQNNKHARELADNLVTRPWTGQETVLDSNLRMIMDTTPKAMKIITPPRPLKERIHSAQEGALDYQLSKISEKETGKEKNDDNFRELYRERLMGPSVLLGSSGVSTMGLISSMADVRINEHIDKQTGHFKHEEMHDVRGKPLSKEHLANATDTNYFMNRMLQKQECLPPWIEAQQGVNKDIERLRFQLDKSNSFKLMHRITNKFTRVLDSTEVGELKKRNFISLVDPEYHQQKLTQLAHSVKDVNLKIRSYNLSSPSLDLHKWKLVPENELKQLYVRVLANLDNLMEEHRQNLEIKASLPVESESEGFLSLVKGIFT